MSLGVLRAAKKKKKKKHSNMDSLLPESHERGKGLFWELNPGPLAPKARIMPLDQTANEHYAALLEARAGTSKLGKFLVSILTQRQSTHGGLATTPA